MKHMKIRKLEESDAEYVSQIIIRGFNWFFKFHEGREDYVEACKRFREAHNGCYMGDPMGVNPVDA